MRYHWLAHHLVQVRFPELNRQARKEIVSEAVCRAWCSFTALDYRLMQSCVDAAAQRKGLVGEPGAAVPERAIPSTEARRQRAGRLIRLADYR